MACFLVKENVKVVSYLLFLANQNKERKKCSHMHTHMRAHINDMFVCCCLGGDFLIENCELTKHLSIMLETNA